MWGKVGIVLRFFENFSARMKFFFIFIIFLLHCSLWLLNSIGIVLLCDLQRVEKGSSKKPSNAIPTLPHMGESRYIDFGRILLHEKIKFFVLYLFENKIQAINFL